MLALYAFRPRYCPVCGGAVQRERDSHDWDRCVAFECRGCGLVYQKADLETMLIASDMSGGDAKLWT